MFVTNVVQTRPLNAIASPITLFHDSQLLSSGAPSVSFSSPCIIIISASLSINIASVSAHGVDLSSIPSVGLSVSLSVRKCTMAKQLNGSGCRLGW